MIDEQYLEMIRKNGMHPGQAHMGAGLVAEIDRLRIKLKARDEEIAAMKLEIDAVADHAWEFLRES